MNSNNSLLFFQKFFQNPKQIGSLWPSSRFLARKMVQSLPWDEVSAIAELGSGTGVITKEIKSRVSEKARVFLFEKDETMRENLQKKYPKYMCHTNAVHLKNAIMQHGVEELNCVISGLPFFNFPKELQELFISQIISSLKSEGYFIAFQYSFQMKKQLAKAFKIEKISFVPLNFPPAFVYLCRKK